MISRRTAILLITLFSAFTLIAIAFRNLGNWFSAQDPLPGRIDVLFTCSEDKARLRYSSELFDKYTTARWIVSKSTCDCVALPFVHGPDSAVLAAKAGPVRLSGRITFVDTCKSTVGEIMFLNAALAAMPHPQDGKPLSVAVVSCPYHLPRLRMLAALTASRRHDVQLSFLHPPLTYYRYGPLAYDQWWRFRSTRIRLQVESEKIAATLVTWFIPGVHIDVHLKYRWPFFFKDDRPSITNHG